MSDNLPSEIVGQSIPAVQAACELTIDQLVARVGKVHEAIRKVMKPGVDIMTIPGVKKPVATKSFAEKLGLLFMFAPSFSLREERDGEHREVFATCTLTHSPTGTVVSTCDGSCSTMESKYRWRESQRACPKCGSAAIIKGKAEYGGGWLCFQKKGGCGAKFAESDPSIVAQQLGRVENPDIADTYNTVRKMAQKRAYVGAILIASGASDLVTQDMDDLAPESTPQDMMPTAKTETPPPADATVVESESSASESFVPPSREKPRTTSQESERIAVVIGDVSSSSGTKKDGSPWTRWDVTLKRKDDGTTFVAGTFSDTLGPEMKSAKGMIGMAVIAKNPNPKLNPRLEAMEPINDGDVPF